MSSGPSLCSCKWACKYDLGIPLQSDGKTFWRGENCGRSTETFLLAKTSTRRQQVYQNISLPMCHYEAIHQEVRLIHPSSYSLRSLRKSISMDYMIWPYIHQARKWLCICGSWSVFEDGHPHKLVRRASQRYRYCQALLRTWVWVHFGIPKTIIFNRDNQVPQHILVKYLVIVGHQDSLNPLAFHPQTDGQTKVVKSGDCAHPMHMYNSKHPREHGMRVFPMFNTITPMLFIAPSAIDHLRWD